MLSWKINTRGRQFMLSQFTFFRESESKPSSSLRESLLSHDLNSEDELPVNSQRQLLSQEIKTRKQQIESLTREAKHLFSLIKKLYYLHEIDDLDHAIARKSYIKKIYQELLNSHPNEAKTLESLKAMSVDLYEKRIARVILSYGRLKSQIAKDGFTYEDWETIEIDRNEKLKENYKKALRDSIHEFQERNSQRMIVIDDLQRKNNSAINQMDDLKLTTSFSPIIGI